MMTDNNSYEEKIRALVPSSAGLSHLVDERIKDTGEDFAEVLLRGTFYIRDEKAFQEMLSRLKQVEWPEEEGNADHRD